MPPLQQTQTHGSPPKPNPKVLSLLLKAIIMALLASLFFLFLGLASAALLLLHLSLSHHRHRHRHRRGSSLSLSTAAPSSGLSPTVLDALPRFRLKRTQPHRRNSNSNSNSDAVLGGDDDCVVCLDAFKDAQWCRKLSACGHVFHMRCVDSWLAKVAACPICRAPVRSNAARTGSSVVSSEEEEKNLWVFW